MLLAYHLIIFTPYLHKLVFQLKMAQKHNKTIIIFNKIISYSSMLVIIGLFETIYRRANANSLSSASKYQTVIA